MSEQVSERSCGCAADNRGAICIHTNKITDVCLDKDCIEDLRVYLTEDAQTLLGGSAGAKARTVELLRVYLDVEPLSFQRGYYSVDLTFYYRVRGDVAAGNVRTGGLDGVAVFSKRVVLFGQESPTKIFSSRGGSRPLNGADSAPEAIAEVIDPMVLSSRVVESGEGMPQELTEIPDDIRALFPRQLVQDGAGRRLYVTIGQFSTIRLERDAQLTVPDGQYCIPRKSCCADAGCQEDPCDVFSRIEFPYRAFYPRTAEDADAGNDNGTAEL